MGFRYYKRIGGSKGLGLNLSGSGVSSSYRSKYGTIGTKGFSIRTGIPGLTFRSGWGKRKNKGAEAMIVLFIIAFVFITYVSLIILYNLGRFVIWGSNEIYHVSLRLYYNWKDNQASKLQSRN